MVNIDVVMVVIMYGIVYFLTQKKYFLYVIAVNVYIIVNASIIGCIYKNHMEFSTPASIENVENVAFLPLAP